MVHTRMIDGCHLLSFREVLGRLHGDCEAGQRVGVSDSAQRRDILKLNSLLYCRWIYEDFSSLYEMTSPEVLRFTLKLYSRQGIQ